MTISSRTPEGRSNHCPVCGSDVSIEPSVLFGDATCPHCGSLLWFLNLQSQSHVFERSRSRGIRERLIAIIAKQLGINPEEIVDDTSVIDDLAEDSLDTVELVMQLEEEFDLE